MISSHIQMLEMKSNVRMRGAEFSSLDCTMVHLLRYRSSKLGSITGSEADLVKMEFQ